MSNRESKHLQQEGGIFMPPLFSQLNKENIRYCVLRNYEGLPHSTNGSDIDMWVHRDDLLRCEEILKEISKRVEMPLVSFYDAPTQYKICYLGVNDGVQFDVFKGDIYWENFIMFSGESIEANTVLHNGVKVLSDEYADIQAVVKELIYTKDCRQKYIDKVYQTNVYSEECLSKYLDRFEDIFIKELTACIRDRKLNDNLSKLSDLAQKSISREKSVSKFQYRLSKLKRLLKKPGYVICVEGTDGSGKSFIIDSIIPMLNGAFHNHVTYRHLRPQLLPDIAVLFGKRSKTVNVDVEPNPHANKPSGFLMSLVRLLYYLVDYTIGYCVLVLPQKCTRTHIYLFDRYYYDYYIDQRRAHINLPIWIIKFFECIVPKPDVILCLGGDPKVIFTRKPETTLEEVKRQTNVLKKFCQRRKNSFWIDTTLKPEESIQMSINGILSVMEKRFSGISYL